MSNFYETSIVYNGLNFGSNEVAFQAQKYTIQEDNLLFPKARPANAKGLGRKVQLRPDWESVKVVIMEKIVRTKFQQRSELSARLLATEDKILVECNTWSDTCLRLILEAAIVKTI